MISLKDFFSFKNNRAFWLNLIAMPIVVIAVIYVGDNDGFTMVCIDIQPMQHSENDGNDYNGHGYQVQPKSTVILEWKEIFQWYHIIP